MLSKYHSMIQVNLASFPFRQRHDLPEPNRVGHHFHRADCIIVLFKWSIIIPLVIYRLICLDECERRLMLIRISICDMIILSEWNVCRIAIIIYLEWPVEHFVTNLKVTTPFASFAYQLRSLYPHCLLSFGRLLIDWFACENADEAFCWITSFLMISSPSKISIY